MKSRLLCVFLASIGIETHHLPSPAIYIDVSCFQLIYVTDNSYSQSTWAKRPRYLSLVSWVALILRADSQFAETAPAFQTNAAPMQEKIRQRINISIDAVHPTQYVPTPTQERAVQTTETAPNRSASQHTVPTKPGISMKTTPVDFSAASRANSDSIGPPGQLAVEQKKSS